MIILYSFTKFLIPNPLSQCFVSRKNCTRTKLKSELKLNWTDFSNTFFRLTLPVSLKKLKYFHCQTRNTQLTFMKTFTTPSLSCFLIFLRIQNNHYLCAIVQILQNDNPAPSAASLSWPQFVYNFIIILRLYNIF